MLRRWVITQRRDATVIISHAREVTGSVITVIHGHIVGRDQLGDAILRVAHKLHLRPIAVTQAIRRGSERVAARVARFNKSGVLIVTVTQTVQRGQNVSGRIPSEAEEINVSVAVAVDGEKRIGAFRRFQLFIHTGIGSENRLVNRASDTPYAGLRMKSEPDPFSGRSINIDARAIAERRRAENSRTGARDGFVDAGIEKRELPTESEPFIFCA